MMQVYKERMHEYVHEFPTGESHETYPVDGQAKKETWVCTAHGGHPN